MIIILIKIKTIIIKTVSIRKTIIIRSRLYVPKIWFKMNELSRYSNTNHNKRTGPATKTNK